LSRDEDEEDGREWECPRGLPAKERGAEARADAIDESEKGVVRGVREG
jgi:hypothetical protein